MGEGITDMDNCVGIAVDQNQNVYVYYQNVTMYKVLYWNNVKWQSLLETTQYVYEMSGNSLQVYNDLVYVLGV
jgi:hypothetical protein